MLQDDLSAAKCPLVAFARIQLDSFTAVLGESHDLRVILLRTAFASSLSRSQY
jgi:hypothetical protein